MTQQRRKKLRVRSFVIVFGAIALAVTIVPVQADPTCPQTSAATVWNGAFLDTDTTKSGTQFVTLSSTVTAQQLAQSFGGAAYLTDLDVVGANNRNATFAVSADFNKDGWPDLAGAPQNQSGKGIDVMRNFTWQNENCTDATCTTHSGPAPDFTDPTVTITPKFTKVIDGLGQGGSGPFNGGGLGGRFQLAAADFNGDGWPDIFATFAQNSGFLTFTNMTMFLNQAVNTGGGDPQFNANYDATGGAFVPSVLGGNQLSGTNIKAVDWNKDGKMDLLISSDYQNGSVWVLLNTCPGTLQGNGVVLCSSNPTFNVLRDVSNNPLPLITHLDYNDPSNIALGTNGGFGAGAQGKMPQFDYADVDGDGLPDLLVGAANCCTTSTQQLRIFKGCSGGVGCTNGLSNSPSQSVTLPSNVGAVVSINVADYSMDGKPDVIISTDGNATSYLGGVNGGNAYYYQNNGTSTPYSDGVTQQIATRAGTLAGTSFPTLTGNAIAGPLDYDLALAFDYDNDPSHTPDMLLADGGNTNGFQIFPNRMSAKFVGTGDVTSGLMPLGSLSTTEMVVTAARITPSFTLNGGTVTWFASNETPNNFVAASPCTDVPTDYCVAFPKPTGRDVRWKATITSDVTHSASPSITQVSMKFDYTAAKEQYRAGTIVADGIAYIGAFRNPGDRGRFYALDANLSQTYWEVGAKLDATADGNRNIYTAPNSAATRLDFTVANAGSATLQSLLGTPDLASTTALISWVRSARFGVNTALFPLQKLGSIETSTAALLAKPGLPAYYSFATSLDRTNIDGFVASEINRKQLVLFGAKDGMLHAIQTRPTETPSNPITGTEAWAFIPPTVANRMLADETATLAANAAKADGTNNPSISAYPDGSPTLADVHVGGGSAYKTLAVVAEGNGGRSFSVLDVTDTIDLTSETIFGPTPMWTATAGDAEAGLAFIKPAVVRVLVAATERWFVVAGSGIDFNDATGQKGRIISAYDAFTGTLMWKFETKCPVTTDISSFETDDTGEPGSPTLNGYIDRVVFADDCGYVYKLDPAQDLAGGFMDNTNFGTILANTTADGKNEYAVFSTKDTPGALGQQRPIAGTIAARTDSTTRMVLFFGTGGLEQVAPTLVNEFYAVYADTGLVRSKLTGTCTPNCEKFYGGIVVTPTQVLFTRTVDPVIGTGTCDTGATKIDEVDLNAGSDTNFTGLQQIAVSSAVMGGLFGDAGAIYFATLSGDVARIGAPRAGTAGQDTVNGVGQGSGDGGGGGGSVGTTSPFELMGWRVVL